MATLEVCSGTGGREFHELTSDEMLVGRDQFCDIVLRNHTVSRQHARIVRTDEGFFIEDLSSLNGTYINGRRLEGRTQINDQDRIHIYEVVTVFHTGTPSMDEPAEDVGDTLADIALPEELKHEPAVARTALVAAGEPEVDVSSQARFRAALKISLDLDGELDVDQLLPKILDSLFEIFPQSSRGYILLEEGTDGHLVPRAIKHRKSESGHSMTFGPISRKMALHVMSTAEAILMDDAPDQAEISQSVFEEQSLSMICAPLMGPSRRPLGIVYLDTTDPTQRFTQADLDVLVSVAGIAAQGVESAGAGQTAFDVSTYQRQLGTAKQVQLQFLPQSRPELEGYQFYDYYQPADEVGGDYFGYILLPDGRLALAIGDVAGKGVSAALLMAHFCAEVRYCLATCATPAAAVDQLNQDLSSEVLNYHFVTFVLCVLDPRTHTLTVVNAGHLPPLKRRNGVIEELGGQESGLPLGCEVDRPYEQVETKLEPGDTVLLYTDGMTDAMNAAGRHLRRLADARGAGGRAEGVDAVGEALLDDVRRFIRGRLQSDDICLVCFSRER